MRKLLVTGGTGFVGRHLLPLLVDAGCDVVSVQRRHSAAAVEAVRFIAADLSDAAAVRTLVEDTVPDTVIHLAGHTAARASLDDLFAANVLPTRTLLGTLAAVVPGCRVVLVGSAAEYGPVEDNDLPVTETRREEPVGLYGVTKLMQGLIGHAHHVAGDLEVMRVRPFNITGPGEPATQVAGAFAAQIAAIERGTLPPVIRTGPLSTYRDFTDVRDIARALLKAALRGESGAVYNACSGVATQIREVLALLVERAAVECRVEEGADVSAGVSTMYGSFDKLEKHTGWRPEIPLRESLGDLLAGARILHAGP